MNSFGGGREPQEAVARKQSAWAFLLQGVLRLPRHEWTAFHRGRELRVVCDWPLRTRLFVDGGLSDSRFCFWAFNRELPLLTARLASKSSEILMVEVFALAPFAGRVKICVNGRRIGGDTA